MNQIVLILQIAVSVALSAVILMQARGTGLGATFGETGEQFRSKRGVEKLLHQATIVLIALFLITSVVNLLVS